MSGYFGKLKTKVADAGGTQETIEGTLLRTALTVEEYRPNWAQFVRDAIEWTKKKEWLDADKLEVNFRKLTWIEKKEYLSKLKSTYSNEKRTLCRKQRDGTYRIKLVRSGIKVPLDGEMDILVPTYDAALEVMEFIAKGFDDGELDKEIKKWMEDKLDDTPKKKMGETDAQFNARLKVWKDNAKKEGTKATTGKRKVVLPE